MRYFFKNKTHLVLVSVNIVLVVSVVFLLLMHQQDKKITNIFNQGVHNSFQIVSACHTRLQEDLSSSDYSGLTMEVLERAGLDVSIIYEKLVVLEDYSRRLGHPVENKISDHVLAVYHDMMRYLTFTIPQKNYVLSAVDVKHLEAIAHSVDALSEAIKGFHLNTLSERTFNLYQTEALFLEIDSNLQDYRQILYD